jgi:hypothetical protein
LQKGQRTIFCTILLVTLEWAKLQRI